MTSKSGADRTKDENLWHFESWLSNMEDRAWLWYSSQAEQDVLVINLEILNVPVLDDALIYVLYSQGISVSKIKLKTKPAIDFFIPLF